MNRFIRFYNKNRHMFWVIIVTVIGIIALVQVLDKIAYKNISKNINSTSINNISTINTNYSVITGEEISNDNVQIIEEFIDFCNNKQIEEAYQMLSDECKQVLYPTVKDFLIDYYSKIFKSKKAYACQGWITAKNKDIYRIDFVKDMLATGEPSKTSIVDYYTIVKNENNEDKLNINKFIGVEKINKTTTNNNITVNILEKNIYMDYEIYNIEVINKNNSTVMLDNMQSTNNIYVEDYEGEKYYWNKHEILENDITIIKGLSQNISIKFNKNYKPTKEVGKIVFSNVILNNKSINISVEI